MYRTSCATSTERACRLLNYNGAVTRSFFALKIYQQLQPDSLQQDLPQCRPARSQRTDGRTLARAADAKVTVWQGAQVKSEVEGRKLALCSTEQVEVMRSSQRCDQHPQAITFKCVYAFAEGHLLSSPPLPPSSPHDCWSFRFL